MARAGEDPIALTPGAAVAPKRNARRRLHPILPPLPVPSIANIEPAASRRRAAAEQHPTFAETTPGNGDEAKPKRRRGTRGARKHRKAAPKATVEVAPPPEEVEPEGEGKAKRRRGTRGGRKHKKATSEAEAAPQEAA